MSRMTTDMRSNHGTIGLLLSGGLDSGILLRCLLQSGRRVRPFYVRSQLVWEEAELKAVSAITQSFGTSALVEPLVILEMPLGDLYGQHWSITGQNTPNADTPDKAVYLPGRNALLTLKPALWCTMHGIEELALAVLASNPFADATHGFFDAFAATIGRATGSPLRFSQPFRQYTKADVMKQGIQMPLELTFSCIAPVDGLHCGCCNKCAERQTAFRAVNRKDPTEYVEKRG